MLSSPGWHSSVLGQHRRTRGHSPSALIAQCNAAGVPQKDPVNKKLLYLVNPSNPVVSSTKTSESRWNRYKIWKPLGLLVLAGMTPPEWEIAIIDENLGIPDYSAMRRPDLVGITAFTSQAGRAYEIADGFRTRGVPVVMGGIHATMCLDEASAYVDSVVTGEAESIWPRVLDDARAGSLKPLYSGERLGLDQVPLARHDLLPSGYQFGSIQISRGCPLNCSFCSVTAFNGGEFRVRPTAMIIEELKLIKENYVLVVDDNLIGTNKGHAERVKELFRAMIHEKVNKKWFTQVTINMADDEELLELAARSGCVAVYIGFETTSREGLKELNKRFNLSRVSDYAGAVRRIRRHGILVVGSFIMGLDVDGPGIGREIAESAISYDVDLLNLTYMTPLPGTRLWDEMKSTDRIAANRFPVDWKYYNLVFPVAHYNNLSWEDMIRENLECNRLFYSYRNIAKRVAQNVWHRREPFGTLVASLSYRNNAIRNFHGKFADLDLSRGQSVSQQRSRTATTALPAPAVFAHRPRPDWPINPPVTVDVTPVVERSPS